jgi:hypothetical protein
MAKIRSEQLSRGIYNITGSFTGSFDGDGEKLTNLTLPLTESNIYIGNDQDIAQGISLYGDIEVSSSGFTTIQPHSVTYDKMQLITTASLLGSLIPEGGNVEEIPMIESYLLSSPITTNLNNVANWDGTGNYIGPTITGTFQGQSHYNSFYWFTAIDDNMWIRLIRG